MLCTSCIKVVQAVFITSNSPDRGAYSVEVLPDRNAVGKSTSIAHARIQSAFFHHLDLFTNFLTAHITQPAQTSFPRRKKMAKAPASSASSDVDALYACSHVSDCGYDAHHHYPSHLSYHRSHWSSLRTPSSCEKCSICWSAYVQGARCLRRSRRKSHAVVVEVQHDRWEPCRWMEASSPPSSQIGRAHV